MPGDHLEEPGSQLSIWILGGFRVASGPREIPSAAWPLRKSRTLVKLLALTPGHRLHREQVTEWLWPDLEPPAAANNLRKAMHIARRVLEADGPAPAPRTLSLQDDVIMLARDAVWIDADAFEQAVIRARTTKRIDAYQSALGLYGGELLPEDRYEEWSVGRRDALQQEYLALLYDLAALYEAERAYGQAIETFQLLLVADAGREEAHRGLMRLYAATGQRLHALRQYQILREALSREFDAAPDAASQRLYEDVVAGTVPPAAPPPPAPARPPADQPARGRTNLPLALTSFVGRTRELAEVRERLAASRQLTLVGAGGVGKTRLALEVAAGAQPEFPDGVWLVDLSVLPDATLIPQAVASVLDLREETTRSLVTALSDYLLTKRALLLLDNCEHVASGCVQFAEALLRRCPDLRILATSREVLGVAGEAVYRVSSLSVPDARQSGRAEHLLQYDGVRLFLERAALSQPGFTLTAENASMVAAICTHLDGIPLALELAAARLKALPVEVIAARLNDRFRLLTGGTRTAMSRHQTLRAAMDWSYDLLPEPERALLRHLSVFAGGFTLDAAQAVGAGDALDEVDVLNLLAQLVDKSMVLMEPGRYRLLETVRQYIQTKLVESGEAVAVRRRHGAFFGRLADEAAPALRGPDQAVWLDRLENEHDNLRAALEWSLGQQADDAGVLMTAALSGYWHGRGYLSEGRDWLERALRSERADPVVRMRVLIGAGRLAFAQDDFDHAGAVLEQAVPIARGQQDREALMLSLAWLGHATWHRGQHARGVAICEESRALGRSVTDPWTSAVALAEIATMALHEGDPGGAARLLEESLALFRRVGDTAGIAQCLYQLGILATNHAEYGRADVLMEEALGLQRQLGRKPAVAASLGRLGRIALMRGQHERAAGLLEAGIALADELGKKWDAAYRKCGLGLVALARGEMARAAALFDESLPVQRALEDTSGIAESLAGLGTLARYRGEHARAKQLLEESLRLLEHANPGGDLATPLFQLGMVACAAGDLPDAARLIRDSLQRRRALGDQRGIIECLEGLARVAEAGGSVEPAARLLGAADGMREAIGTPRWPVDEPDHERVVTRLREALGGAAWAAATLRGRTDTLEENLRLASDPV